MTEKINTINDKLENTLKENQSLNGKIQTLKKKLIKLDTSFEEQKEEKSARSKNEKSIANPNLSKLMLREILKLKIAELKVLKKIEIKDYAILKVLNSVIDDNNWENPINELTTKLVLLNEILHWKEESAMKTSNLTNACTFSLDFFNSQGNYLKGCS